MTPVKHTTYSIQDLSNTVQKHIYHPDNKHHHPTTRITFHLFVYSTIELWEHLLSRASYLDCTLHIYDCDILLLYRSCCV